MPIIEGDRVILRDLQVAEASLFHKWFADPEAIKYSLSRTNNSGEYFIFIGDKAYWGKGYGTEVTKLVVSHGFQAMGLHRIVLTVSAPNIGGIKAYTRAGFKQEGVLRDAAFRDGVYHDKIVMSALDHKWCAAKNPDSK